MRIISLNFTFSNCRKPRPEELIQYTIAEKKDKRATKAHVNAIFFRQLKELLSEYPKIAPQFPFFSFHAIDSCPIEKIAFRNFMKIDQSIIKTSIQLHAIAD